MDLIFGGSQPPKYSENWMKRYAKPLVVGISVMAALSLTVLQGSKAKLGATPRGVPRQQKRAENYDLTALVIFNEALTRIHDNYVDPHRVNPKQMLVGALHFVERSVAEVLVEEDPAGKVVHVKVGTAKKSFDISEVNAPWTLSGKLRDILGFIQPHLKAQTKVRDVEYAAIGGMLNTLDPHSLLLKPETYNEMKLSTRGHFGGLGIVISMVKGVLTVINPMKHTPAHKAGIKSCDQILKIGEESTINMTLTQAVNRLRGEPGSKVEVTLMRKTWKKPLRKTLTRAVIMVPSITSRMLKKKVGYIRLKNFQGNSTEEMRTHLEKLHRQGMRSLVLDLRGNPGGLLDQSVRIADLFIRSGTLLTTVSHAGKGHDEKRATSSGTERDYPIAVLVSSGSASASEIVAGALKNLDRAVVIGTRTFGKGSVQVLYDNRDGSALKLTIAEYRTPGDVSIQAVGITPDIYTAPVFIREDFIRLERADYSRREQDLNKHLTSRKPRGKKAKPLRTVPYLARELNKTDKEKKKKEPQNLCLYPDRDCKDTDEDRFVLDFQIKMARDLMAQTQSAKRSQILKASDAFFKQQVIAQEQQIIEALKKHQVNWSKLAPAEGKPKIQVSVTTDPKQGQSRACKPMRIKVTVHNSGDAPTSRLQAVSDSSNLILKGHEFAFGKVAPGESKSWEVPLKIRDEHTRIDEMTFNFREANGNAPPPYTIPISIKGVERPVFAYGYQLIDDVRGNQDGQVQRGETVRLLVKVRNTGKGRSLRTVTTLKNLSGEGIFLRKGRFTLGKLDSGEKKVASFTFDVRRSYAKSKFKVELTVWDDGLREYTSEKLTFRVAGSGKAPVKESGMVRINASKADFHAWGAVHAPVVGHARRGASFKVTGRLKGWYRVQATPQRTAFIATRNVSPGGAPSVGEFIPRWQVTPPKMVLRIPTYSTEGQQIKISGTVTDETRVTDMFIFVRNPKAKVDGRKVFYRSNDGSKTPRKLSFSANIPLWAGANYVSIHARESEDVQTAETLVIFRKPSKVAAKNNKTSKR